MVTTPAPHLPFPPQPPVKNNGKIYTHGYPASASHTSRRRRWSHRARHLHYIHSLAFVLLQRHTTLPRTGKHREDNAIRIGRCLRILWSAAEWRDGELWELGLAWSGLIPGQTTKAQAEAEAGGGFTTDHERSNQSRRDEDTDITLKPRRRGESHGLGDSRDSAYDQVPFQEVGSSRCSSIHLSPEQKGTAILKRGRNFDSESDGSQHSGQGSSQRRRCSQSSSLAISSERCSSTFSSPSPVGGPDDKAARDAAAERRMAFLRKVATRRPALRPLMLAHRAQELIAMGRWREALDEIEL